MEEDELIKSLRKTRQLDFVGEIYPVIEDADGGIVDGNSRKKAGWDSVVRRDQIKTKAQKIAARLITYQRKRLTFRQRRGYYDELAVELIKDGLAKPVLSKRVPIKSRGKPRVIQLIAELTGVDQSYVARFISPEFKRGTAWQKDPGLEVNPHPKRSTLETRAEMLTVLFHEDKPMKPTRWMYRVNLSYTSLKKQRAFLYTKGLVEVVGSDSSPRWTITEKGKDILRKYQEVKATLVDKD